MNLETWTVHIHNMNILNEASFAIYKEQFMDFMINFAYEQFMNSV